MDFTPTTNQQAAGLGAAEQDNAKRLALWTSLCEDYFFKSPPPELPKKVLTAFVHALANQQGEREVVVNMTDAASEEAEPIRPMMLTLGFQISGGKRPLSESLNYVLPGPLIPQYEQIKNEVRRKFHADAAARRQQHFLGLLKPHIKATPTTTTLRQETSHEALAALIRVRSFSTAYAKAPGSTPFLKGLHALLESQLRNKLTTCFWELDDAVFTETALKTFTADAIDLLCASLDAVPVATLSSDGRRRWVLGSGVSNPRVESVLRRLPSASSMSGFNATGQVGSSAVSRTNADGARDGDRADSALGCPSCCLF